MANSALTIPPNDIIMNKYKTKLIDGILFYERIKSPRGKNWRKNKSKERRKLKRWNVAKQYFNYRCAYCMLQPDDELTKDHFIPRALGRSGKVFNIIPSCKKCNKKKDESHPSIWCSEEQLERIYTFIWHQRFRYGKYAEQNISLVNN